MNNSFFDIIDLLRHSRKHLKVLLDKSFAVLIDFA
jgi:hypothetical protein